MTARKRHKLHEIRVAAVAAMHDGKSEVYVEGKGVLLISWHPLSRLAPNVAGDGFALADETDTHDDVPTLSEEDIRRTLDDTARRNRRNGDH